MSEPIYRFLVKALAGLVVALIIGLLIRVVRRIK